MHKFIAIPALIAVSVTLAACSSKPNPNLESARANLSALEMDPQALKKAPFETQEARDYLLKTDKAVIDGAKNERIDQMAYLTNQRVEVAKQTILLRTAEEELKDIASDREKALLEAENRALKDQLNAKPTERGTVVTFGDLLFDFDRSDLKPSAQNSVRALADHLKQNPERQVLIEGFTDSVGSESYNQRLSEARANSVRQALIQQGIEGGRIQTQGFGEAHPVADNSTAASRAFNRRVEVTISHDDKPVPRR